MRLTTCIDRGVMQNHPPHNRLILDALFAAVLLTVRGSSSSLYIQTLPAFDSCLTTYPSRKIAAKSVRSNHRQSLGLPLFLATLTIAIIGLALSMSMFSVPPPDVIRSRNNLIVIVTDAGGRVEKLYVSKGMNVRVGDPIIQFDARELLRIKRRLESRIHEAELNSPKYDSELPSLYRELSQTQARLNQLTIVSPSDGEILAVAAIDKNDLLTAGTAIALIASRAIADAKKPEASASGFLYSDVPALNGYAKRRQVGPTHGCD